MLLQKIQDRSATVGVIGLGYVGLPLAQATTRAGFHVIASPHATNDEPARAQRLSPHATNMCASYHDRATARARAPARAFCRVV